MGGLAGHLNHLTDDLELTFGKLKRILRMASNGEIVGTEKIDGQNMYFGYNGDTVTLAKNRSHVKAGGIPIEKLVSSSRPEGREALHEGYRSATAILEKFIDGIGKSKRLFIFQGGAHFNCEIVYGGNPNVIEYDGNFVIIHDVGHVAAANDQIGSVDEAQIDALFEHLSAGKEIDGWRILRDVEAKIPKMESDAAIKIALVKVDEEMRKCDLSDANSIYDYIYARIDEQIRTEFSGLSDEIYDIVVGWMMGTKTLRQIPKDTAVEIREKVKELCTGKERTRRKNLAIMPLHAAILEFTVEILQTMESALIVSADHGENANEKLKVRVQAAIDTLSGYSGDHAEYVSDFVAAQTAMLNLEKEIRAFEGVVFQFDDKLYKLTGNFTPINQLLGMIRYGRGPVKPIMMEGAPMEDNGTNANGPIVAIVPGAFKPPHAGHMHMVKHYSEHADRVVIFISPLPRRSSDGDVTVDVGKSIYLWEMYLDAYGIDNVQIVESPVNSPVAAAYQFVTNVDDNDSWAQPGDRVVLGVSNKDDDTSRFSGDLEQYAREGVRVYGVDEAADELGISPMPPFAVGGQTLSSSDMRNLAAEGAVEEFMKYLPKKVQAAAVEIIAYLADGDGQDGNDNMIREMVRYALMEKTIGGTE